MTEIWFRHADARYPFLRDDEHQPAARWHADGHGPAQYLADTPDGAWAEFLRHEEIVDEADLAGVSRDLWAIEIEPEDEAIADPRLPEETLRGGRSTYAACRAEAARLRARGATALVAPTAGLRDNMAGGQTCSNGALQEHVASRDGRTMVLFGARSGASGWRCCHLGRPDGRVVALVRPLTM
jgi:hypothetical protein